MGSFSIPHDVMAGPRGQLAHRSSFEQVARLERKFYTVRPGVWTLVGNGLSNQTFIEGPGGIIAIDTGECVEEMQTALKELRLHTDVPIVAVLYTHFHYVSGTTAIDSPSGTSLPVYGHERIVSNIARASGEIGPSYARGLVQQFGTALPVDGPDGLVSVGLGLSYRNPDHRPFTPGFIPPTTTLKGGESLSIAGLRVEVSYAPSDADDSLTYWFPDLGVCVQNNVWPAVFNVYAIRGEEYRNPQNMLPGIDHVIALNPEHLITTHGPPLSGADDIRRRVIKYRDVIQLIWDQTVRLMNRGHTMDEIAHMVELPPGSDADYFTTEHYGLVEHHVRQVYTGIRGWFDDDPEWLFPLPPQERADRLVSGFGGAQKVRQQVASSIDTGDLRWALELASWLWKCSDVEDGDRALLASALRKVGQQTTAANIRNWCLTRARDIEGAESLDRHRVHRLRERQVAGMSVADSVRLLRVLVIPERAHGIDAHLRLVISGETVGLHLRNCVAVMTNADGADDTLSLDRSAWAKLLGGSLTLDDALSHGTISVDGDPARIRAALRVFDLPGFE